MFIPSTAARSSLTVVDNSGRQQIASIDAACGQLVGDVIDRTKRTAMLKASRGADTIEVKAV